jgi:gliding motility-associated-like protein
VFERNGPSVTAIDVTETLCAEANGAIRLTVSTTDPGLAYNWSHDINLNSATATGLLTGPYTITITDASTCDTVITVFVPAVDKPVVDNVIVKDSYCNNNDGSASVQVSSGIPPYVFTWSHDTTLVTSTANNLSEGSYSVTVTDANGCDTSLTVNIVEIAGPELVVTPSLPQTIFESQAVDISVSLVGNPIDTVYYQWLDFLGLDCYDCTDVIATPTRTTTYQVVVTDVFTECQDTAFVTIIVKDETNIFIPNAITPNGDGANDFWVIRELETFPNNEVVIINRWGDVVFSASPYQNDFDGTFNGKELPSGTYYYIIKLNNIGESVTGPLTIVK